MTPLTTTGLVVGYVRISDDPQGLEAGVRRQEEDEREMAARRGVELARVFVDNDLSATKAGNRPEYAELMHAVGTGQVRVILVWHLSRLWRNRRERAEGIELCRKHGVSVWCVRGPELDLTTAYGRGMAGLLGEFDTMEVEVKSERQKRANAQRAAEGKPVLAKRLFGYTTDRMGFVEAEAEAVKAIFADIPNGVSVRSIVRRLNDSGFTTAMPDLDAEGNTKTTGRPPRRGGKAWTTAKLHNIVRNPVYAGFRIYEGEEHAGTWPALVDRETWDAANRVLSDPERFHGMPLARRWLGSGLYRCGLCGALMVSTYRTRPSGMVRIYKCTQAAHLSLRADPVDELVADVVCARLSRPDAIDLLVDDTRPDVEEKRREAEQVRQRIAEAGDLWEDGTLSAGDYKRRVERLRTRLAELEAATAHVSRAPLLSKLVGAEDVRARWDGLELDQQRLVIATLTGVTLVSKGSGRRAFDPESVVFDPRR